MDLSHVEWSRGGYDLSQLSNVYTQDDRRATLVIDQFRKLRGDSTNARVLGFCVSVAHAEYMALRFNEKGIKSLAVHGGSTEQERLDAPRRLADGAVNVIFTCDLYNEGVDIPEIDTLLLLRPTESALLFQQQLGRGLRHAPGKANALVLDFIGQCRREFRFDRRLEVLTGQPRGVLCQEVEKGFPLLPPGCSMFLDKVARDVVLANLRMALQGGPTALRHDLLNLRARLHGDTPSLARFLADTGRVLDDVYAPRVGGWTGLCRFAGILTTPPQEGEAALGKLFGRVLHVDDRPRLNQLRDLAEGVLPDSDEGSEAARRGRLMIAFRLSAQGSRPASVSELFALMRDQPVLASELSQLVELLGAGVDGHGIRSGIPPEWPLLLHRHYTRDEVLVATGVSSLERERPSREGVLFIEEQAVELFFVTLNKSEKTFKPSTRYEDYAVSAHRFHWQSQSTTPENSPTGRRYRGVGKPCRFFLFVREHGRDADGQGAPYLFLGPVRYSSHHGSRPMNITWDLETALPAKFLSTLIAYAA